jgi:hypothetical protein
MLNPSTRLRAWLHEDLPKAKTPHKREFLERTVAAKHGHLRTVDDVAQCPDLRRMMAGIVL